MITCHEEKCRIHCTCYFLGPSCRTIYIIRLKSCNILYAIYMVFPGGLRRIKISPLGEDLRQGSNQVRNQVLRHQGNFFWWKGRISPHPLMLLGPLEKYSSKKLLKDMVIYKPTRNQWQCKVSICGICSKSFNAIWLWLPRSHAVMVELKPCCGSAMRRVPADLTWLFLLNWCTTVVLIGPKTAEPNGFQVRGSNCLGNENHVHAYPPTYRVSKPRIY